MRASLTQPALIGGLVMGVLTALPFVAAGNVCCCLWVVSGGVVAAYVLQQNQTAPITAGDGALAGLLAGLFGALVTAVLSIPIGLLVGPSERRIIERVLDSFGNMPSGGFWDVFLARVREALERADREGPTALWVVLASIGSFVFWLCVGAVFSTLGGLLGAAIFRKPPPPPGTIDVPPTAM